MKEIGKTIRKPQAHLLFDTIENITIAKKHINVCTNILNKIYI